MPSSRFDEVRDYAFADQALAFRKRAGLTQRELAALLRVSGQAVHAWEGGLSYPDTVHLKELIALYLARGALTTGREEEEAAALWATVRAKAVRRTEPFDPAWFAALHGARERADHALTAPIAVSAPERRDWGDAPAAPVVQGRAEELAALTHWIDEERCRVVQVLGGGGIGKTTLAARLAYELAPRFAVVYWRSLRNAPPAREWLAGAIAALSGGRAVVPDGLDARLGLLLELLRGQRALLVLDNLETVLEPGASTVRYRVGYEGYGAALARLAENAHEGCLLLTSRERPLQAEEAAVRALRLDGLGVAAARALLNGRVLAGGDAAWGTLVERYGGNPLALRVVGETIGSVFGGDIAAFLAQNVAVFGGVRQLLDEQVARLSAPEQAILDWLAVGREPVGFAELAAGLGPGVARGDAVEAVEALRRRSLLEWAPGGAFTLQPVVLEYTTARLIASLAREILAGEPALLVDRALLKARARDYIRRSQERLLVQPLLDQLQGSLGSADAVERQLVALLEMWRARSAAEQGYGPGNVVNVLRLLRGNLRGLDLSGLTIRHAYLQGVEAQDVRLVGAHLVDASLAEAFDNPTALAVSADGAYLALGTSTGEVCLWRVADRVLLLAAAGHAGAVLGVALSGDGGLLASGSLDGTIKLWDTAPRQEHPADGGHLQMTVQGHTSGVRDVALSVDGQVVAGAGHDGTINLWEVRGGRLLATLEGHSSAIRDVALSGDGRLVIGGSYDGSAKVWEVPSPGTSTAHEMDGSQGRGFAGHLPVPLQGASSGVWGVALSASGTIAAGGSEDRVVRLWEARSGRLLSTLEGHTGTVPTVALSGDGRLVASGSFDGTVKLWDASSERLLSTLQGHAGGVWGVALSGDGRLVASSSFDGAVKLWGTGGEQLLGTLQGNTSGVWGVALRGDGRLVASGSWDGMVRLWDVATRELRATLEGHTGAVPAVALSGDGRLVASGSFDQSVKLWDAANGRLLTTLEGHAGPVHALALTRDGRFIASGSLDGTVRLWDTANGRPPAILEGHSAGVYGVALSGDGRLVASGSFDRLVMLWDAASGRLLATLEGHTAGIHSVALSDDGLLAASGSLDGAVRLWDTASGRPLALLEGHSAGIYSVALSGDGRLLASGSFDGAVKLWEVASGRLLAGLEGHISAVRSLALSEDGRLLASGSQDGTVRVWKIPSGEHVQTLRRDRHYERMDITGLTGTSEAQRTALLALGAIEHSSALGVRSTQDSASQAPRAAPPPVPAPTPLPAPSPARPSTNLLQARTPFVGRTADVGSLTDALDPATHTGARLLTLTGVAGCGKSRLALVVADAVLDAYAGGAWLVELAPLPARLDADCTPIAVAALAALGLREQPGREALDILVAHLQSRRTLLVLDNCEHLVAACAALAPRLLAECPNLQILATSQRALGVVDETIWPLAPLDVPAPVEGVSAPEALRLLGQSDAVRLFVERAQAVRPGFVLSAATAASVAAICRRLDGLPLAIELAAARLNVLQVDEILARLEDRFRLLRHGRHTADRHQALQATMDWSYGLLDASEQALSRRLAVFSGGWEVGAAEVVCVGEAVEVDAVLELLDELLERSLLYVYGADGVPRYGLLETVRQYGLQQLERTGEAVQVRDRHLHWCVALVEQAAPALQGPEQAMWLARLAREHDNLRAALQWALDRGLSEPGLRLGSGLWQFWRSRSHLGEGRHWLMALLALPNDDDDLSMAARATVLEGAAWLAEDEHDFAQASALFAQSSALRRALGLDERQTGLLINAAMEARARGDYARAVTLLEESLARQRALGNRESIKRGGLGLSLARLALVLNEQGEYARASALYEECLALHRELGDQEGVGNALLGLGDVARDRGDAAQVRMYCGETLAMVRDLDHTWVGFSLNNLAQAAFLDGNLPEAVRLAEESGAFFRDLQAGPSLAEVLLTLGRVEGALGEAAAATAHLAEALGLARAKGPRWVVAAVLEELGVQAVRRGRARRGARLLAASAAMRRDMGTPVRQADRPAVEGALASARAALGDGAFDAAWTGGETMPLEQIVAQVGDDAWQLDHLDVAGAVAGE